jgi:hypothetical protein
MDHTTLEQAVDKFGGAYTKKFSEATSIVLGEKPGSKHVEDINKEGYRTMSFTTASRLSSRRRRREPRRSEEKLHSTSFSFPMTNSLCTAAGVGVQDRMSFMSGEVF